MRRNAFNLDRLYEAVKVRSYARNGFTRARLTTFELFGHSIATNVDLPNLPEASSW